MPHLPGRLLWNYRSLCLEVFWFLPIKSLDVFLILPSGNLLHSYWKWWFIVDLPSYNMVDLSIVFCGCLPEGKSHEIPWSLNEIYTNLHEGAMEISRNRPTELRHLTSAQTRSSTSTSSAWTTGWGVNREKNNRPRLGIKQFVMANYGKMRFEFDKHSMIYPIDILWCSSSLCWITRAYLPKSPMFWYLSKKPSFMTCRSEKRFPSFCQWWSYDSHMVILRVFMNCPIHVVEKNTQDEYIIIYHPTPQLRTMAPWFFF